MTDELKHEELRWILAHELGHISRGDHYVRWIEWLACVAFWWNPVAWWARRNLRQNEEICCDALVLRTLQGSRHSYANSLLQAVEFLTEQGPRPPAMASEINSGGFLKRRFEMIVSKNQLQKSSRLLRLTAVAFAAWLLPLGVAYAQNPNVRAVAERLERAVKAGEMSKDQMDAVLRMLKQPQGRANKNNKDKKRRDVSPDVQKMIDDTRRRVRELVEAGEMTREEAGEAMEKRIAEIKKRAGSAASKQRDDKGTKKSKGTPDKRWQRLEQAVKNGDMTEAEAKQKYVEWEKSAKAKAGSAKKSQSKRKRKAKGSIDREGMLDQAQLRDLVERGVMTREQAKQRWERSQKEMAKEKDGRENEGEHQRREHEGREREEERRREEGRERKRRAPKRGGDLLDIPLLGSLFRRN